MDDSLESDEGNALEDSWDSALNDEGLEEIVVEVGEAVEAGTGTPNDRPGPLQLC